MSKILFGLWVDLDNGAIQADDGFGNLVKVEYTQVVFSAADANLVFDLF